jgi:hypothetical protein
MPALAFVALVGLVLVSLLASDLFGLPKVSHHRHLPYTTQSLLPYTTQSLATTPTSAPDMTSEAVLAARPSKALAKVDPAASAARAETQRTTVARAARAEAQRTTAAHAARAEAPRMQLPSVAISRPLGGREFGLSGSY